MKFDDAICIQGVVVKVLPMDVAMLRGGTAEKRLGVRIKDQSGCRDITVWGWLQIIRCLLV